MGNRYVEDLRRIIGIDPNQGKLNAAIGRSSIAGKRGMGYINSKTGGAQAMSGVPGQTLLPSDRGEGGDAATGENNSGKEGTNPNDPQTGIFTSADNAVDAEDIIDGNNINSKVSSPQITNSGLKYTNNGTINTIEAVDCDTGDDIDIRIRGPFVPPEGWEDADTPPAAYQWQLGVSYGFLDPNTGSGIGAQNGETAYECASNGNRIFGAGAKLDEAFQSIEEGSYNGYGDFYATYDPLILNPVIVATYGNIFPIDGDTCSPGVDAYCPTEDPTDVKWPADNKYNFKLENGQFITSDRDDDVPLKYKEGVSKVDFCFGAGGSRKGAVEVTKDNGYMIYEKDGVTDAPTGIIRAYDGSGQMTAAFDSTAINSYRPASD